MIKTALTERFGIKYPIVGGAMMRLSTADYVAAVSDAGGLGILASANYPSGEEFAKALDRIRELTDKPFGVNINFFPAIVPVDNNIYVDAMVDKGVSIVETSGHTAPEDICARFKENKMTWIHKCVAPRYAKKAESLGADVVTVVGYENGGATGKYDIGTMVLIPLVKDAVGLPVIGGGGVADGRGLVAALSLGADAVIMGTRLMLAEECPLHPKVKEALLNASELDTMLIMRSIESTHRVWANTPAKSCLELEKTGAGLREVLNIVAGTKAAVMYQTGDLDAGVISCGQGVGLSRSIKPMKDILDEIMGQAESIVGRYASMN
jgi:nitronate monooxygenase